MNDAAREKRSVDCKGLSSFLVITFVVTYAIEGALILGGFRILPGAFSWGQYVIAAVMWVPALATLLTVKLVTHEGLGLANIRFGGWRPYVAAGLIIPGCFVLIYAVTWILHLGQPDWSLQYFKSLLGTASGAGASAISGPRAAAISGAGISAISTVGARPMPSPAVIWPALFFATLVVAPFINGVFGFGEELGWRGYLLPELLPLGKFRAYLLVGVVWGLWHLPLVLVGFTYPGYPLAGALMFIALTAAFGIYLSELTLRYRSSVLAGWAHGVFNGQKLGVWALLFPGVNPLFGGCAGIVGIGIWLILGIWESRRRLSLPAATSY